MSTKLITRTTTVRQEVVPATTRDVVEEKEVFAKIKLGTWVRCGGYVHVVVAHSDGFILSDPLTGFHYGQGASKKDITSFYSGLEPEAGVKKLFASLPLDKAEILTKAEVLAHLQEAWKSELPVPPVSKPRPRLFIRKKYKDKIRFIHPTDEDMNSVQFCGDGPHKWGYSLGDFKRRGYSDLRNAPLIDLRPHGVELQVGLLMDKAETTWKPLWVEGVGMVGTDGTSIAMTHPNNYGSDYEEVPLNSILTQLGIS